MGIQGLLPLLKSIMVPIHIKDLEGCSVAIDTYSWLHKGALSCSTELCKGLPTSRHIEYCMHRVNLLRHYGVKPVLVFDGGLLPMKIEQENKRARARKENLARAIEHESYGNSAAAYECYQKAVDISPSTAHELIVVLKQENVCFVVAPYEADAQMTFLAVSKQVDAVITEDSDLIPFGCPRVIFKMDKFGQGVEFKSSMLQQNKELSFAGFTKQMLLEMCILSGCDYLQSLSGMGLKRAHALMKKFKSYDKVIKHLRYSSVSIPPLYEESFKKAIFTFQHQRVYDPIIEDVVHLSDISDNIGDDLDFLGPSIPQHIAQGIARGDLDPFTQMPFQGVSYSSQLVLDRNLHLKSFKPESERKKLDLPVQKNLLTNYFCFASLEAKRTFRAPRVSPKHSTLVADSSISPKEHIIVEDSSCEIDTLLLPSPDSANTNNSAENGFNSKLPEYSESPSPDEMRSPDHALPLESNQSIHGPSPASHKEHDCSIVLDAVKSKTITESRKVIIKSRYFQNKQHNENDLEDKQGKFCSKDGIANDLPESGNPDGYGNTYFKGMTLKRKNSSLECVETENVNPKQIYMGASRDDNGHCNPKLETFMDTKAGEAKFGSNISHLGRYSDIAEKSMERFVSVISSFRFSSPGSRASGLRAPLKDARNTCTNRSSASVDLSQFAYVPKN
ncbi:5'-3' exonuclease family protein isoform 1 [Theobroma cacao]|uniref:Exonuclease 1 n=1 Tax=Theobroma cacao TaxID=3641 RepID=A0A061GE45_THECC|nr:5'-3' exonuclease family protein isoform 1 [Theobroma cacao]EOY27858.1 5'-3' exonuclease family protein isoform 1 [Theobroma cacao]EOY27860.1 5'-3' exonuclease family protein isoform 1 [Theobroma cacao]